MQSEALIPKGHCAIQDLPPPANTDHVKKKFLDVPYAHLSPVQKLDIYLPDEGGAPFRSSCPFTAARSWAATRPICK